MLFVYNDATFAALVGRGFDLLCTSDLGGGMRSLEPCQSALSASGAAVHPLTGVVVKDVKKSTQGR